MDRHFSDHLVGRQSLRRQDLSLVTWWLVPHVRRQRKIIRLVVLRARDRRVDRGRVGEREALVVAIADRRLVLRLVLVRAHGRVAVVGRVGIAIRVSIVRRYPVRRLDVLNGHVLVGVQQALIKAVAHLVILLRMLVVVESRHLHHSDAVLVLRVEIKMLAEAVAVVIDLVAVHRKAHDQEQQQNDADDGQDCRVGGRQEVVVHDRVNHDVTVAVAVRSEDAVVTGRLGSTKRCRELGVVVVCVTPGS